jgi:trimethylamine--corrinoid protein Co-methyltransferase
MTITNNSETVRPRIQVLSQEQIDTIHRYSVTILEETGIKVESKTALKIFEKSRAVRIKDDIVYIQGELIDSAIKTVPSSIEIYNKAGDVAFNLGKKQSDETYFGIGATNTYFQNIQNSRVESFTRKHMQHSVKLGDMLMNYDMVSTVGIPSDVSPNKVDLYTTLDMYANTSKPLVLLILEDKNIDSVFDLLSYLHGDISAKPFYIPYFNPITPLILNTSTSNKMIAAINHHLPIMYSNYSMSGGTSPVTEGGSLALLNAELLAGLVFGQLIKEGSEIILGSLPAVLNMKTTSSYYSPSSYVLNLACAEMMDFYGIPHCGTSGSGNGWQADLSASGDLWQNHLTSCIGKVGCVPFVGGNFDSMVFSPGTVVLSDHIIGEARKFTKGFSLNDMTVNITEIDHIGHGGNYLTSEQTLTSLSGETSRIKPIWPSLDLDSWKKQDMPKAEKFLIEYTLELYGKAIKESNKNSDITKKGEEYIINLIQ